MMGNYNNYFPATYQPYYAVQQQPYTAVPAQQQPLSSPVIHADILQVDSIQAGENYPLAAGQSLMMMTKDEQAIMIKTMNPDGTYALVFFDRRKEAPKASPYITREEFESRMRELFPAKTAEEEDE